MLLSISIGFSLSIFALGTYFIWFSKRNIFNHLSLGLCLVAYVVPAFVTDLKDFSSQNIIELYTLINFVGAISYICGLLLGNRWRSLSLINGTMQFNFFRSLLISDDNVNKVLKLTNLIFFISLIGIAVSFLLMGFVPLFAADPYMAKFFKGEYQDSYKRVAFLYRTSRQLVEFLMPLKVLQLYYNFTWKNFAIVFLGIILIAISLNRTPILSGVLVAIAIIVALKKNDLPFNIFVLGIMSAYIIGSSIYFILGTIYPDSLFGLAAQDVSFFQAIAYGSPDITDQLQFLNSFLDAGSNYTYGLTFIGGLIPFNFPWNPSVYTLLVLNNTDDISQIASGGLRLPPSLWGYVSFGWFGVVALPFTSGFFLGYIVKKIKRIVNHLDSNMKGCLIFFIIQFAYTNIGSLFSNFYLLSIYAFPAFILFFMIVRATRNKAEKTRITQVV